MDQTDSGSPETPAPTQSSAMADVDVLPELAAGAADRSMLIVQYGLALIAAIAAILLTQAS